MPVLSSKSRDFLGSSGPEKGASPTGQKFADDLAQEMGAPHLSTAEIFSDRVVQSPGASQSGSRSFLADRIRYQSGEWESEKMDSWVLFGRPIERVILALCVPLLLHIGYRLFVMGAKGEMELSTKANGVWTKFTNVSPGALCFLLGAILGIVIMQSSVNVTTNGKTDTAASVSSDPPSNSDDAQEGIPTVIYGGLGDKESLSGAIEAQYAKVGMRIEELAPKMGLSVQDFRTTLSNTRKERLKKAVSLERLQKIRDLEALAAAQDERAKSELTRLRQEYLVSESEG